MLFLSWGTLNLTGFCFDEMKYLSKDEFFTHYLDSEPGLLKPELWEVHNWLNDNTIKAVIPYSSGRAYIEENPDCCSYGSKGVTPDSLHEPASFFERFLGFVWGFAAVHHRTKYVDASGNQKQTDFHLQNWVTSCGQYVSYY